MIKPATDPLWVEWIRGMYDPTLDIGSATLIHASIQSFLATIDRECPGANHQRIWNHLVHMLVTINEALSPDDE